MLALFYLPTVCRWYSSYFANKTRVSAPAANEHISYRVRGLATGCRVAGKRLAKDTDLPLTGEVSAMMTSEINTTPFARLRC